MIRLAPALLALTLLGSGCIKLDGFMFDPEPASSVEEDYHGLPLSLASDPPAWIDEASVDREIYLRVPDGERLDAGELDEEAGYVHGAFLPAPAACPVEECPLAGRGIVVLYQHGNSGNLWRYWYRAVALWTLGVDVFVYTYRGYGMSRGEPSADGVFADADTALRYVRSRPGVGEDAFLVAYGYSMGAIPTSYLAGTSVLRDQVDAVALESGLDGPASIVQVSTGVDWPAGFWLEDTQFDGPDRIAGVDPSTPILHLHGGADVRVLTAQAERYHDVLEDHPAYTHYIGLTDHPHEQWMADAAHRNVPIASFGAEHHIADYWDDEANPGHCCVHPLEYADPQHADFLDEVGLTDGAAITAAAEVYAGLLADWLAEVGP